MNPGRKKKTLVIFLCLLLLVSCMSGCGQIRTGTDGSQTTELKEQKNMQIAFLLDSFVIERWQRDRDVFVSVATKNGAEVLVQSAGGKVSEQIEQIRYCIRKQVDAIVIVAVDSYALQDAVQEAKNAGIYVIAYDRMIMNAAIDYYISFDSEGVGRLMAEHLLEKMPQGGNIVRINGSEQDHNVELARKGFYGVMDSHPEFEIVHEGYCAAWEADPAYEQMQQILDSGLSFDAVVCGNDDLASMVYKALSERGMIDEVLLIGQDAELSACQRIVKGWQSMTVYKSVEDLARLAAGDVQSLITQGKVIGASSMENGMGEIPSTLMLPVAVTAENLDSVIIEGGFHMRNDIYGES